MCQHLNIRITKLERIDINQIEMECIHIAKRFLELYNPLLIADWHIIYVEIILIPPKIVIEDIFAALRDPLLGYLGLRNPIFHILKSLYIELSFRTKPHHIHIDNTS